MSLRLGKRVLENISITIMDRLTLKRMMPRSAFTPSGSMRSEDVSGYATRRAAVYDVLARDFFEPQRKIMGYDGDESHVVSLIEMSSDANVVFERHLVNRELTVKLLARGAIRAKFHGNYLPALDKVREILLHEKGHKRQLFVIFLSDGAPSDHAHVMCEHRVLVWQQLADGNLTICGEGGSRCRARVKREMLNACLERIKALGTSLGQDRLHFCTVAFGPEDEDYEVLQRMAGQLPRGSFHKLRLTPESLRTAFSTLTSSLTSLRSDTRARLTERAVPREPTAAAAAAADSGVRSVEGWHVYRLSRGTVLSKLSYRRADGAMVAVGYEQGSDGIAHAAHCFGQARPRAPPALSLSLPLPKTSGGLLLRCL